MGNPTQTSGNGFFRFLRNQSSLLERRPHLCDVDVEYDCYTLFGRLPRRVLRGTTRLVYAKHPSGVHAVLKQTFWFNRLKPVNRQLLLKMFNAEFSRRARHFRSLCRRSHGVPIHPDRRPLVKSLNRLKEFCNTVDGLLVGLYLGVPETIHSYKDTDALMVSAMSNCIQNHDRFLRSLKKTKKEVKKAFIERRPLPPFPRCVSFLKKYFEFLEYNRDESSYWYYRLAMLTQTRASGLPTGGIARLSEKKFQEVLSVPCTRTWNRNLLVTKTMTPLLGLITSSFNEEGLTAPRISISTSSCFECTRAEGGKAEYCRRLLQEDRPVFRRNLTTGEVTDELVSKEDIGNWIFYRSLERHDDPEILHVRYAQVREPSKVRSVTTSSFFHSQILQPLSHLLLKAMSGIEEFRTGIKGSRDGWSVYRSIDDRAFEPKARLLALSTDLETATDYFNWFLVEDFLDVWISILTIPPWYAGVVKRLLTSPRVVFKGKEVWFRTKRGCLMGDPVTKAILTTLYVRLFALVRLFRAKGDDLVAVDTSRAPLKAVIEYLKSVDVKISEDDTFVSPDVFVYTEEMCRVPRSRHDRWETIRKTKRFGRNMYVDYPKIRLLLDTNRDEMKLSTTPQGKIDLLGRSWSYVRASGPYYGFSLASVFQDVLLRLFERKAITYLPHQVCGSGKIFPYHFENVYSFERRRGFLPVVLSAMERLSETVHGRNIRPIMGLARVFQKHSTGEAWATEASRGILSEYLDRRLNFEFPLATLGISRIREFIVSEDELMGKILSLARERWLLGLEDPPALEEELDMDVLLNNLPPAKLVEHDWIFQAWLEQPMVFTQHIVKDWFERTLIEEMALKSVLHVTLPYRVRVTRARSRRRAPVLSQREKWELFRWYKSVWEGQPDEIPVNLIDDDEVIAYDYLHNRQQHNVVVTDDLRLLDRLSTLDWRSRLYRIPVTTWVRNNCSWNSFEPLYRNLGPPNPRIFIDTAQVQRVLEFVDGVDLGEHIEIRDLNFTEPYSYDFEYVLENAPAISRWRRGNL